MMAETFLSVLRLYQVEMDSADPEQWEALADLYEQYGMLSNAHACRQRAAYYRKLRQHEEGGDEKNR